MDLQVVENVTKNSHPAVQSMLDYLESIATKDIQAFAKSFGSHPFSGFFANLPGSVKVKDIPRFIEMHRDFFASSVSRFSYGALSEGVGNDNFFICSVPADVTLPDGSKRRVNIDMTFFKKTNSSEWLPARFINTVVDISQAVLH